MSAVNAVALLAAAGGDYQISRSVRLRSSASAYFNRTPANGNRTTWTWSGWVKRGSLGTGQTLFVAGLISSTYYYTRLEISSSDKLSFIVYNDTNQGWMQSANLLRDPSAWYHLVFVFDTNNATSTDRMRMYINGVRVTSFASETFGTTYPASGGVSSINSSSYTHKIGRTEDGQGTGNFVDGYLTEVNFIDGQALTPSSFGETDAVTGVWKPKKYAGTYGTNGFYLNFSDNSAATAAAIGKDYSGNGNNWTPNNISVTAGVTYDSMLDVPTPYADGGNGRGNYAVMNPLAAQGNTVADGNLKVTLAATSAAGYGARGTMAIRSGDKFYWEVTPTTSSSVYTAIGINDAAYRFGADFASSGSNCVLYYKSNGNKIVNGTTTSYGTTYAANDVIGIAVDYSANTCTFYLNNVSQGSISLPSTSIEYIPVVGNENGVADVFQVNFGQRPFTYTPPTGFKALNTQNLPDSTIKKGNQYFDASTYTGTGASKTISSSVDMSGGGMLWTKCRSNAQNHDVHSTGLTYNYSFLQPSTTSAETTDAPQYAVTFNSGGGYTLGTGDNINQNTYTYVGWQWKESASAGFDIVTFTGDGSSPKNIAHSLGVAPKMIIIKSRNNVSGWNSYHASLGNTQQINLQSTAAASSSVDWWNNTSPTSSQFTIGANLNISGWTFVAYCFAEVAGFSKFGSYTGNGSADGPMIFTGFRPAFVMVKASSVAGESWALYDNKRDGYNIQNKLLYPNLSNAENAGVDHVDLLSNGFKLRSNNNNTSGATYIYAAFAENPFKNSLAR